MLTGPEDVEYQKSLKLKVSDELYKKIKDDIFETQCIYGNCNLTLMFTGKRISVIFASAMIVRFHLLFLVQ